MINKKVIEYKSLLKICDYEKINKKLINNMSNGFEYIDIIIACVLQELGHLDKVCIDFISKDIENDCFSYKLLEIKDKDLSVILVNIAICIYFNLYEIDEKHLFILNGLFLNAIFTKFTINFYLVWLIHIKLLYNCEWLWSKNIFNSIGIIDDEYDKLFKIIENLLKSKDGGIYV